MKLRLATCRALPEPDIDAAPLAAALGAAGIDASVLAWDDPAVDWDAPVPTLLRSTWNYTERLDAFLAWVDRVAAVAPLWNPPRIVRGNVCKRYLLALASDGVATVPTLLFERGAAITSEQLAAVAAAHDAARVVIKPEVGAAYAGARAFGVTTHGELVDAAGHLATLTARGAALVQPYLASVEDYGERSLIWIDGELTHAIRKAPRLAGGVESVTGPFPIADDERAVALAALAPIAADILYARIDLVRDFAGEPRVMELELVEPSLFFAKGPHALDRLIAGLRRREISSR
jgi:hypothetical protein